MGAAGYVSKPVDLDKVRTTVQQIVGPPEVADGALSRQRQAGTTIRQPEDCGSPWELV